MKSKTSEKLKKRSMRSKQSDSEKYVRRKRVSENIGHAEKEM